MLKLYGTSVINGLKISTDARNFQFWILCEIFVAISTMAATSLYLMVRAVTWRSQLTTGDADETQDFMSSD